jgi:hypothetical protein
MVMYALIVLQYVVAKKDYASISDNQDNLLLGSYFSTVWCAVVGIGAHVLKASYLSYSRKIENIISRIHQYQIREKLRTFQLNLKDYENSQLHGTVLNTLIAIRNSPNLSKDRNKVSGFVNRDLDEIESHIPAKFENLERLILDPSNFPFQRELFITLDVEKEISIPESLEEIAVEIIRELILNTKKHTDATHCHLQIVQVRSFHEEGESSELLSRHLRIEITDNSLESGLTSRSTVIDNSSKSESLRRLLRTVDGKLSVSELQNQVKRSVEIPIPEPQDYYLHKTVELREESIRFLGVGYIRITLFYAALTLPAYLLLDITSELALLLLLHLALMGYALTARRGSRLIALSGAIVAISSFPLITRQDLVCSQIQYLPWLFNGLIGSVFFATLLIRNKVARWLPVIGFYLVNLELISQLPGECSRLLDGSTPAIILIVIIAMVLAFARRRDLTFESKFISETKSQNKEIEEVRMHVIETRKELFHRIRQFAISLSSYSETDISHQLNRMIHLIKAFLLISQHFQSDFARSLYQFVLGRYERGLLTTLEVNVTSEMLADLSQDYSDFFTKLTEVTEGREISLSILGSSRISVEITATDGSDLPRFHYDMKNFYSKTF